MTNTQRPLEGKRIVLDPGHGFGATGAIGHAGTREVDINIGVTRELAKLLRRAGARVFLTWDEMDQEDLAQRVEISLDKRPDLFLSIHHNATAPPDPARNRIEVYYPFDGDVQVQDLATALAFSLKAYSGLPVHPPLPARYRVLKGNVPLSILVEPAYVSHRAMEKQLQDPGYQAGEAQALFQGIQEFFETTPPHIEHLDVDSQTDQLSIKTQVQHTRALLHVETPRGRFTQVIRNGTMETLPIPQTLWQTGTWYVTVRAPGGRSVRREIRVPHLPAAPTRPAQESLGAPTSRRVLLIGLSRNPIFVEVGAWVRESLKPLGIEVVYWGAEEIPHDEVALLKRVEAHGPDLVLLLENNFRWPEGWYFYYRDRPSRAFGETLAEAAAFYGLPDRCREGSTYFLIQARPSRVLFNGYVRALPLASALITGIVRAWFREKPIRGEDAPPNAWIQVEEGYFLFATPQGRFWVPYTQSSTVRVEGG